MTVAPDPVVKAILPWFGGKRTLAPDIVQELGKHTQYFEPFCGGLSIIFSKPRSQKETVNDLHGDAINLARVIQEPRAAEKLYDRLQRVIVCEGLLEDARRWLAEYPLEDAESEMHLDEFPCCITPGMLDRAYWYFLASWMGRNGTAGASRQDYQIAVRWTNNGGSPAVRFQNAAASLPAWHIRLQNVVILKRDAFNIIPRFEDARGTAIYVDPPYPAETRSGWREGNGSEHRYLHEFQHDAVNDLFGNGGDDHARLAKLLRNFNQARIIVSSYDCSRVRELYAGWTFVDKSMKKKLHLPSARGPAMEAPEVLILNGPSYAEAA